MMRSWSKRALEGLLLRSGLGALARSLMGDGVLVLAYHNIIPRGSRSRGERSLHLSQQSFALQLDELASRHEVVPLDSIFDAPSTDGRRIAITFDDAYRGAVTAGIEEVVKRRLPATIFAIPGLLGGSPFWWDVLADDHLGKLEVAVREAALHRFRGENERVMTEHKRQDRDGSDIPDHARTADVEELEKAGRQVGITVASHTWSHPNLGRLSADECMEELERSKTWLAQRFPSFVPWLSYPYGLSSDRVEAAAREVGYRGALLFEGGWLRGRPIDRYRVGRLNVPADLSLQGFSLRLAGLLCR